MVLESLSSKYPALIDFSGKNSADSAIAEYNKFLVDLIR